MHAAASPGSDDERIYICKHCPKRYARKDYLERHELNRDPTTHTPTSLVRVAHTPAPDTRPGSVCPACGKGFARPDVLRKHLSTSCKSRRGSDGDAPAPLTTAEEDALVPRKRRRPQRRATATTLQTSPSPSWSASDDMNGQLYSPFSSHSGFIDDADPFDRQDPFEYASNASASAASASIPRASSSASSSSSSSIARFPGHDELDSHARAAPRPRLTMPELSGNSPRFIKLEPDCPAGPARAGASLDLPLAPAFAATPETLGPLSFTPAAPRSPVLVRNNAIDMPVFNNMLPSPLDGGVAGHAAGVGSLPTGLTSTIPAGAAATTEQGWNQAPAEGNSMDDLFSWLMGTAQPQPDAAGKVEHGAHGHGAKDSSPPLFIAEPDELAAFHSPNPTSRKRKLGQLGQLGQLSHLGQLAAAAQAQQQHQQQQQHQPFHSLPTYPSSLPLEKSHVAAPWDDSSAAGPWRFLPGATTTTTTTTTSATSASASSGTTDAAAAAVAGLDARDPITLGQMKLYFELYYV
ncbi:uncharacterized protein EHS24_006585 [Apiotrichum porosum]|uniref:C2H2-type domain-containing protein n=1 Tax=Apiotrichum porosum TaxID=105984 RepID=A0A427Y1H9_9TREE|nr:uncharacterized protein EHS24_006585 [Apiotrichum porosum]RSH85006.1 hypothetical protein EHS24_006585 [Apiotrichum porosum]